GQPCGEAPRHRLEELVAGAPSKAVVHCFEAVQVAVGNAERTVDTQQLRDVVVNKGAVGKVREGVVERLVSAHLLCTFAFGYVLDLCDSAPELPLLVAGDGNFDVRPEPRAVAALELPFQGEA